MKDPNVNTTYTGLLHKYQPSAEHHPCYSGLQVQGAATTPAARYFNYQGVKHFPISLPNCCLWSLWTFSCLHTALTSNFACRLPGIGLPHGLPLLQRPIRHALALFLDFLCDSLCSNVQFRMPASRDWTSTRLTTALTSNPSCCGALFGLPL